MALILQYVSDFQYYMDKFGGKSYDGILTLSDKFVSDIILCTQRRPEALSFLKC